MALPSSTVAVMSDSVRVLTWNVLGDDSDRARRGQLLAAAIQQCTPDLVSIQEAWPGLPEFLARETGLRCLVAHPYADGHLLAILSSCPAVPSDVPSTTHDLPALDSSGTARAAVTALVRTPAGRRLRIMNTHLAWGGDAEGARLAQVEFLDGVSAEALASDPEEVHVLTGDFNATPASRSIRFLTGLDVGLSGRGSMWVDAWSRAGTEPGWTSDPGTELARATARAVGILRTDLLPPRRIDYVFVRGFAYGRPGCPLSCRVVDAGRASDHHAVLASLWDPPA